LLFKFSCICFNVLLETPLEPVCLCVIARRLRVCRMAGDQLIAASFNFGEDAKLFVPFPVEPSSFVKAAR